MYTRAEIDAWLGPLTDPKFADAKHSVTSRVWAIHFDGRTWATATDGRALILVAGEYGHDEASDADAKGLLELLDKPASETRTVTLAEIQEWLGPPPSREPVKCKECGGTKSARCSECSGIGQVTCEYDHSHKCPDCRGDGAYDCEACDESGETIPEWEIDDGVICGLMVDRRRLAYVLRGYRDQELTISACEDWLRIHSTNTEAILMGINQENPEAPEFKAAIEKG